MPNYYEMLNIEPSASAAQIETAWDERYNQWRRLVTHHDPQVQLQAQQAIQTLERVRETLTDPTRRNAYDAGIGIGGPIGGLADPSALLQSLQPGPGAPPPPPPPGTTVGTSVRAPTGLWACPKCQADNPPSTKFCFKCGTQLVRRCPECKGETSLIATGMCGNCGFHVDAATRREEIRQLLDGLTKQVANTTPKHAEAVANAQKVAGLVWGWICLVIGVLVFIGGFSPGGGSALVIGLLILGASGFGIYGANAFRNRWKAEAGSLEEILQKSQDQIKRLHSELGAPRLNRS